MQTGFFALLVLLPAMGDVHQHLGLGTQIYFVQFIDVTIEDNARRNPEACRISHPGTRIGGGEIAIDQEVTEAFATVEPVFIETGDCQCLRDIDLIDEGTHLVDDVLHLRQLFRVDRGIGL